LIILEIYDDVKKIPIDQLKPYHNNPKEHPPDQKGNNITLYFMKYINTNWALFQRALVNRGGIEEGEIIKAIVNNKKFQRLSTDEKMYNIRKQIDIEKFSKHYEIGGENEWSYLESYIPNNKIDKMAKKLHKKLGL
jgi:hypothetical protein